MNRSSDWIDKFGEILKLCAKFRYDVTERLFACLRLQGGGKFKMKEIIDSVPEKDRFLIAQVFPGYSDGNPLVGCTKEEAEKLI